MHTAFIIWLILFVLVIFLMAKTGNLIEGITFIGFMILALPVFLFIGALGSAYSPHCDKAGYDTVTYEKC